MAELNEGNGPDILVLTHDLLVELNEKEKLADVLDIMDANSGLKRTFVARTTKMYNNIQSRWESLFKVYGLD